MRVWSLLILALLLSILIGAAAGHDWMSPADLLRALAGDTDLRSRLLIDWRLPRVLAAACVGALLGLGGTVFQGVFRNPLAEPYLLGSAGGAALGATVALLVPLAAPQSVVLPVLAFAGAWGATMLVIGVSRVAGAVDAAGMLLAGVAVAAVLSALRSFLMLALSDETVSLQIVLSWVLGGVQTPTWPILGLLAAISVACLALTLLLAGRLDVLGLGETMAIAFGLNVNRFIAFAVLAGSVVVAAAVAFGGLVAFVGLASPHIARWLVGPLHRPLLPASALVGAIIGPNGAGKSTLLKVLTGIDKPTAGTVQVGDRDLASLSNAQRASTIGYLPQYFEPHWDLSVAELVRLGADRSDRLAAGAIEAVTEKFELTELGQRRWSTLSGGERARVLLATVLVVDPPVLLADEPAASLDIRHRLDVIRALTTRRPDRLSVVVVHDLDLAFTFFERVVVIDRGKVVADGPAKSLIDDRRIDDAFSVRFDRLKTPDGWLLRASTGP
jgi:ABC-type Fe3+-siderophore transport system permease subunit/ABC-type cobalamin/Fe3+-siderophores transport system ATPase subunit